MYFGDYLIEKKIVTPEQLILALSYQLEHLPSLIRIVHESGLVKPSELLELIKIQIKQDIDIFSVLVQKKLITEAQVSDLSLKQWSMRIPLGEVLVHLNYLTKDQLEVHLDSYFEVKQQSEEKASSVSPTLINEAALESLRELGIETSSLESPAPRVQQGFSQKEEVRHFIDVFSERQKNKMLKLIAIINETNSKNEDLGNYINSLFRDLHLVKGAIFLADITAIKLPTSRWDESLEMALRGGDSEVKNWCMTNLSHFHSFLEKLWEIRMKIDSDQTDDGLTENFPLIKAMMNDMP